MSPHLEEQLQRDYPVMFQELYGDMAVTCMAFGIECRDGWYDLIARTCKKIAESGDTEVIFSQIKEKFGSLTIYYYNETDATQELIQAAERESYEICEICGEPGEMRKRGWLRVVCEEHK